MIRRSTFCAAGPFSNTVHTGSRARWRRVVDELRRRIDVDRPHVGEACCPACRFCSVTRHRRPTATGNRIDSWNVRVRRLDFGGRLPLAIDRREAPRVEHRGRRLGSHLEQVLPEIGRVDELRTAPGHAPSLTTRSSEKVSAISGPPVWK